MVDELRELVEVISCVVSVGKRRMFQLDVDLLWKIGLITPGTGK